MTTSEARAAVRKVYDQWAALAKLHEALSVAEGLEGAVKALEQRQASATAALAAMEQRHAERVAASQAEIDRLQAECEAGAKRMRQTLAECHEAVTVAARERDAHLAALAADTARLAKERESMLREHEASLASLAKAETDARARLTAAQRELDTFKQRAAQV